MSDLFLRRIAWWLCGTILYLQLLSLLKLLDNVVLTAVPLIFALIAFIFRWRRSRSLIYVKPVSLDLAVAVLAVSIISFLRAIEPPRGFDVLAYHLPYVVEWMRDGWAAPYYSAFSGLVGYYPGNLELLALPILSFTSSAYLLNSINVLSFMLLAGVVWAVAGSMNVRPSLAVFVMTLLMFTSKVTMKNFGTAYNDLFLAAALLSAWYFAEQFFRTRKPQDLWPAGLLIGVAAGSKYIGVLYGTAFLVYFILRSRRLKPILTLVIAILLPSLYWYARNYLITGSPVYPQGLSLAGNQIFAGSEGARPDQLLLFHLTDLSYLRQLFSALLTNGHLLLLPLLVIFPLRKFYRSELRSYWIAGLACFVIYLVTPLSAQDYSHVYLNYRYALPFQWFILTVGALALLASLPLRAIELWLNRHMVRISYSFVFLVLLAALAGGYYLFRAHYPERIQNLNGDLGKSWAFMETLPPSHIAYAGWNTPGALYGSRFQHTVEYVNINSLNGRNYHQYHNQDYRAHPDYEAWRMNLTAAHIDVLWIYKQSSPIEYEWVNAHPEFFSLIYEDESVIVVRVVNLISNEIYPTALYQ